MLPANNNFYMNLGEYVQFYQLCVNAINNAIPILEKYARLNKHRVRVSEYDESTYFFKYHKMMNAIIGIRVKFENKSYEILDSIGIDTYKLISTNNEIRQLGYLTDKPDYEIQLNNIVYTYHRVMALISVEGYSIKDQDKPSVTHFLYIPIAPKYFRNVRFPQNKKFPETQFDGVKIIFGQAELECQIYGNKRIYGIQIDGHKFICLDKKFTYYAKFIISDIGTMDIDNCDIIEKDDKLLIRAETESYIKHIYYIYLDVDNKWDPPVSGSFIKKIHTESAVGNNPKHIIETDEKYLYIFGDSIKENRQLETM